MKEYQFLDENGSFQLSQAENYSGLYFPITGEAGLKSAVTPNLGGDSKMDQNTFLLEPVSVENLHNNKSGRNFWCRFETGAIWSAVGSSAAQMAEKFTSGQDESEVQAGILCPVCIVLHPCYCEKTDLTRHMQYIMIFMPRCR